MKHWIACNISTVTHESVREKLVKMSTRYTTLKKHPAKKKVEALSNNLKHFAKEYESLFDIRTSDKNRQKIQKNFGMSKKLVRKKNSTMVNVKSHR